MKKILLEYRKNKIKKFLYNGKIENSIIIFHLLNNNSLDFLISKLKKGKVITNKKFNNGKRYLTKEQQFISLLNQFITIAKYQFYFLDNVKFNLILEKFITSNYKEVFLLKHSWENSEFIDEYNLYFEKTMISNFIFNVKYCNDLFNNIFKKEKIDITSIDLENISEIDINKILNILREVLYTSFFKFEIYELVDMINKDVEFIYRLHYKQLLENHKKNHKMLQGLLTFE